MKEKLKKNLDLSTEQGSDEALGGAVLWYQTCTHTFPGASLPLLLELQMPPTGTLRTTGGWSLPHCSLETSLLGPDAARSPKLLPKGSTEWLAMHLMRRYFQEHSHPLSIFNGPLPLPPPPWSSSTSEQFSPPWLLKTHTSKQDSGWISWSQGPSVSIKIIEHEISYWSHATGCTSKEAQEGKWFFPKSILNWLPKLSPDPFQTAEWK